MGPLGAQEMILIFVIALLLFGPKKLPELGKMLGKGLTEFRRAKNELKTTFESHMQELERETRLTEQPDYSKQLSAASQPYSSDPYPYPYDEYGHQPPAEETTAQSSETVQPQSSPHSEPVPGTVPRSQPAPPPDPSRVMTEENHPA